MDDTQIFLKEKIERIKKYGESKKLKKLSKDFLNETHREKYAYNFAWCGLPIIQFPQDIVAMQEIIWDVKPDLIIETGVARGGSIIFYASMLELLNQGMVIGIDIDIREHNKKALEKHPFYKRVKLVQGSSTSLEIVKEVKKLASNSKKIMVCLDSNHTYEHVLKELELYSPFVTKGSYLVVFDTVVEDLDEDIFNDRPWDNKNNPKVAVKEFLKSNDRFVVDKDIENKLLLTVSPDGYLKCVK